MICPRCGSVMDGGVCNECGFPVTIVRNKERVKMFILFKFE